MRENTSGLSCPFCGMDTNDYGLEECSRCKARHPFIVDFLNKDAFDNWVNQDIKIFGIESAEELYSSRDFSYAYEVFSEEIEKNPDDLRLYWKRLCCQYGTYIPCYGEGDIETVFCSHIVEENIMSHPDFYKILQVDNQQERMYYLTKANEIAGFQSNVKALNKTDYSFDTCILWGNKSQETAYKLKMTLMRKNMNVYIAPLSVPSKCGPELLAALLYSKRVVYVSSSEDDNCPDLGEELRKIISDKMNVYRLHTGAEKVMMRKNFVTQNKTQLSRKELIERNKDKSKLVTGEYKGDWKSRAAKIDFDEYWNKRLMNIWLPGVRYKLFYGEQASMLPDKFFQRMGKAFNNMVPRSGIVGITYYMGSGLALYNDRIVLFSNNYWYVVLYYYDIVGAELLNDSIAIRLRENKVIYTRISSNFSATNIVGYINEIVSNKLYEIARGPVKSIFR